MGLGSCKEAKNSYKLNQTLLPKFFVWVYLFTEATTIYHFKRHFAAKHTYQQWQNTEYSVVGTLKERFAIKEPLIKY